MNDPNPTPTHQQKAKVFKAKVTPQGKQPIEVEYPADAADPTAAAIKAAAEKIGVRSFPQEPAVEHFRDEVPEEPDTT